MLHLIWYLIIGFISGWIAKAIMHVPDVRWWQVLLLGIVGSIVGGFIARVFSRPAEGRPFHPAGLFMSIIGAILVLGVGKMLHML
jgi:uncharacterized membrane protein YeaQ/YmgE (transglycosylase-associated protein family)